MYNKQSTQGQGSRSRVSYGIHSDRRSPAQRQPYHGRPSSSSGGYRGGQRGGFRAGGRGGAAKQFKDISKFINKAVVTEEVPNFKPEHSFLDFKIEESLKGNILKKGYTNPTPIQDRAVPHILVGQDVVGIANTGTGKTAAFSYLSSTRF